MTLVFDAAAIVELIARSPAGDQVRERLLEGPAAAPAHLDAEVLSALRGLARGGHLTGAHAEQGMRLLAHMPLMRHDIRPLLAAAWSLRENLSAYDALYVALARRLRCGLVTGDARLARAPGLGVAVTLVA